VSLPWQGKPPPYPPLPPRPLREPVLTEAPGLPPVPLPPLIPTVPRWCLYHPEERAAGLVNRGWGADGWVLLCAACVEAVKTRRLVVVAPNGGYGGTYPGVDRPDDEVPPGEDLFE
jgi:hypothetical protein